MRKRFHYVIVENLMRIVNYFSVVENSADVG